MFNGVKVFSASKHADRGALGENGIRIEDGYCYVY